MKYKSKTSFGDNTVFIYLYRKKLYRIHKKRLYRQFRRGNTAFGGDGRAGDMLSIS